MQFDLHTDDSTDDATDPVAPGTSCCIHRGKVPTCPM